MRKRIILLLLACSMLLLAACNRNNTSTPAPTGSAMDQPWIATKNTTRVNTGDPVEAAVLVSKMLWPATSEGSRPGGVVLAAINDWQDSLASLDLVHHPNNGPLLYVDEKGIPLASLQELKRLQPTGIAPDQTQVIVVGAVAEQVMTQLQDAGYKVKTIAGEDAADIAANIDTFYTASAGDQPESVIIGSSEAPGYTIPAGNWIAHMPEPLLYVTKDQIPQATRDALAKRNAKANMYILGPERVISAQVERELQSYGRVIRIQGQDPISNAIAFAQYKDEETGFGWGILSPGHNLSFLTEKSYELAIAAAPFSHLGKHAPMLWTSKEQMPSEVMSYVMGIQPKYKVSPTEGPYNHAWITGDYKLIAVQAQGEIDEMLEIVSATGAGHGAGHGGAVSSPVNESDAETDDKTDPHAGHK